MKFDEEMQRAVVQVMQAKVRLDNVSVKLRDIRKEECDAMNALSAAQKKVDELYLKLHGSAPSGSHWSNHPQ